MLKSKFTPGPWVADIDNNYFAVRAGKKLEHLVISQHGWGKINTLNLSKELTEEQEANARLIAAAPEMYDVIESLIQAPIHIKNDNEFIAKIAGIICQAIIIQQKVEGE